MFIRRKAQLLERSFIWNAKAIRKGEGITRKIKRCYCGTNAYHLTSSVANRVPLPRPFSKILPPFLSAHVTPTPSACPRTSSMANGAPFTTLLIGSFPTLDLFPFQSPTTCLARSLITAAPNAMASAYHRGWLHHTSAKENSHRLLKRRKALLIIADDNLHSSKPSRLHEPIHKLK